MSQLWSKRPLCKRLPADWRKGSESIELWRLPAMVPTTSADIATADERRRQELGRRGLLQRIHSLPKQLLGKRPAD